VIDRSTTRGHSEFHNGPSLFEVAFLFGTPVALLHGPGPGCGRMGGDTHWEVHSAAWNHSAFPFKYHAEHRQATSRITPPWRSARP
jgi:hypothetical protein